MNQYVKTIIYATIIGIFFFQWVNLSSHYLGSLPLILSIFIGVFPPFILLYLILKKRSPRAYQMVIAIFCFAFILEFIDYHSFYQTFLEEQNQEGLLGLIDQNSICEICEMKESLILMAGSVFAICLMSLPTIAQPYDWKLNTLRNPLLGAFAILALLTLTAYLKKYFIYGSF